MHIVVKITVFCLAPLIATLAGSGAAVAQEVGTGQKVTGAHLDYTRYFASPEVEVRERADLQIRSEKFVGNLHWSLRTAAAALDEGDLIERAWMLHVEYCQLRSADDANDKAAADCETSSENQLGTIKAFVEKRLEAPEFASASEGDLTKAGLGRYKYLIVRARENAGHRLLPTEQKLLSELVNPLLTGWSDRYDGLVRQINAEVKKIQAVSPDGAGKQFATDPLASKAREAAYRARIDAYQKHRDAIALTLLDTVRLETAVAVAQHYKTAPERKYAGRLQLSQEQVRRMLELVQKHSDVLRDYQQARADRAAALMGDAVVHSWDLSVSSGYVPPTLPFEQARNVMVAAIKPLGEEYVNRFAGLLDPANGALDLNGGSRRQPGGFSVGFPSVPSALYMYAFDGSIESMDTAIHEGGHAIHRKLISDAGVPAYYANGPNFLSEAYAIFNEFLLLHHLMEESESPEEKTYYQERLLYEVTFQIFTSAEEGELEEALYDGVKAGTLRDADDIDKLNGEILDRYDLFSSKEPQMRTTWARKQLLIDDPLYLVSYLYAGLVACKLYEMQEADPQGFAKKYTALLREGFDAPASDLIKRNMGFELDGDSLLDGALSLVRKQTAELRTTFLSLQPASGR